MADPSGGFSIREYASRMRSIDVLKCWPFAKAGDDVDSKNDGITRDVAESLLPPITVAKFRWWSHELEIARSNPGDCSNDSAAAQQLEQLLQPRGQHAEGAHNACDSVLDKSDREKSCGSLDPGEGKSEIISFDCPVCGVSTASTVNAVNSHIDNCLTKEEKRQMRSKGKTRPPKKRSIVEIFAVAPQVLRMGGDDTNGVEDDEKEAHDSSLKAANVRRKRKKMMKRKKKNVSARASVMEKLHKTKKKKTKKFKKKISDSGSIKKKEGCPKLRRKIASHLTRNLNCLCNGKNRNEAFDAAGACREKVSVKSSCSQKKHKAIEMCKSSAKRQKLEFPVHGILKKHVRCSSGEDSTVCNIQKSGRDNSEIALAEKHVRFFIKDDKTLPERHVRYTAAHTDEGHSKLIERGREPIQVIGFNRNHSVSRKDGAEDHTITGEDQLTDNCDHGNVNNHMSPQDHHGDTTSPLEESNSVTQTSRGSSEHLCSEMKLVAADSASQADFSKLPEPVNVRADSSSTHYIARSAFRPESSGTESIKHFIGPSHAVCAKNSMAREVSWTSSSCFATSGNMNGRLSIMSESSMEDARAHAALHQPFSSLPPANLIGGSSHFPEWSERIISLTGKSVDEDFLGLPLNSQGELIHLNSSGTFWPSQLKNSDMISGSSSASPGGNLFCSGNMRDSLSLKETHAVGVTARDQLDLFPLQNYSVENPRLLFSSNQGFESRGMTTTDAFTQNCERQMCCANPLDAGMNLTNIPANMSRQLDQSDNQKGKGLIYLKENMDHVLPSKTPLTMRLMGKDVAIGRISNETHGYEEEKVWTDKEIIIEQRPLSNATRSFSEKKHFPHEWSAHSAVGRSEEILHESSESQNMFQFKFPSRTSESLFSDPCLGWQTGMVFPNGKVSTRRNPNCELLAFSESLDPPVFKVTNLPETFTVRAEAFRANSQPALQSLLHQSCQHVQRGPELKHPQSLPHSKISPFNVTFHNPDRRENVHLLQGSQLASCSKDSPPWLSFIRPDCQEHTKLSHFHGFSKDLPPWLSYPLDQGNALTPRNWPSCDASNRHHSHGTPASDLFTKPPPHHQQRTSYTYNPVTSQGDNPLVLSSVLHPRPALVPVLPRIKPTSSGSTNYGSCTEVGYGMMKSFGVKSPAPCRKTKKKPAIRDDDLRKLDRPGLETKKHGKADSLVIVENPSLELDLSREDGSHMGCLSDGVYKDGLGCLSGCQSHKANETAMQGPMKLSAGVKHILKPSQNVEHISIPIHSTVPFGGVTNLSVGSEPQLKSTKIYKL